METLISRLERIPISIEALKKVVPTNTKCVLYTQLTQPLFAKRTNCVIVLLESKTQEIGHFVLLIKRAQNVEYWSSYGHRPEYAIKITGNDTRLLKMLPKGFLVNRFKFQSEKNTETCALHCLARSYCYKTSNQEYIKMFRYKVNLRTPDDIVTIMTLLFRKNMALE